LNQVIKKKASGKELLTEPRQHNSSAYGCFDREKEPVYLFLLKEVGEIRKNNEQLTA